MKPLICIMVAAGVLMAQGRGRGGQAPTQIPQFPGGQQNGQPSGTTPQRQASSANAPGQPAAPAVDPGTVEGRVISSTSAEPLRKTTLTLRPNGRGANTYTSTTNPDGSFRITGVEPGRYVLVAEHTGFVREIYAQGGSNNVIEVTSANITGGIVLKMIPQGVIVGRVYDEDGDPIENAQVQVLRYSYPQGRRQLTVAQRGSTNDQGEFRIANLAPGRYYVSATRQNRGPNGPGRGQARAAADAALDYVTTYSPRGTDIRAATPVDLIPGSEQRGVDVRMMKARLFRVRGVVSGLPAPSADAPAQGGRGPRGGPGGINLNVNLVAKNSPERNQRRPPQINFAEGTFEFFDVQPGSYDLIVQSGGPNQQQRLTGRVPLEVTNVDIDNVQVRLVPAAIVTGTVAVDGTQPATTLGSVRVNFSTVDANGFGGSNSNTQAKNDGTFQLQLSPDKYSVDVAGVPDGYYVKAVKVSGRDAPDALVDFTSAAGPVEIVLGSNATDITGRVETSRGEPAGTVQVTAIPASGVLRRDLYKSVKTDANGSFTVRGLPPGDYKLFAWEEVEQNAWMDRDFRQPFDSYGGAAKISDGGAPSVTLKLISRDQVALESAKLR